MLWLLGGCLTLVVVVTYVHAEIRSTWYGITLSNGMDVLVSPGMYREIVQQYATLDEPDNWKRWDQAVLRVIRHERPDEWKLLVRALGQSVDERRRLHQSVEA
jgi:hypothetical protein